jgi:hypothetical protein
MAQDVSENDLLIEDIKPELLRRVEESARLSGRGVEKEVVVLLDGLALDSDETSST